jgi:hypothetical protein
MAVADVLTPEQSEAAGVHVVKPKKADLAPPSSGRGRAESASFVTVERAS